MLRAGEWLRAERERHGWTQKAFAEAVGVDQSQLSKIERGISEPTDKRAERIAELFGLPIIEVRRSLGMWVPPDATGKTEFSIRDVPTRELMQELERRFTESEHGLRKAAGS